MTIEQIDQQNKEKSKVIIISIISNLVLVIIKLIIGFVTGLASIVAEALHSGNDLIASFVAYIGVNKSLKPPDEDHQYGHGKIETVTGWVENILILLIGLGIIYEGVHKFITHTPFFRVEIGIAVMIFSGITNFVVSQYLIKKGKELRSVGVEVDGEHLRADVITSLGTATALIILKITNIWWLDPIAAILIGIWVIGIFVHLSKSLTQQMIDKSLNKNEMNFIYDTLRNLPDIKDFHKIRTRQSGSTVFIDMHIKVDKDLSVKESHKLTQDIESCLKKQFINSNILIHTEPYEPK